ncbi:MAG: AMP-binding protein [Alcaligenaceae bacterium]|nr:AMP-binding protein [Alcaligenaceae bacterium]
MNMLHPEFETLDPSEIRRVQENLWNRQWRYIRSHSKFYQEKLGALARREFLPLDQLIEIPFTGKEELRESQERQYPFGDYLACEPKDVVRLQTTSGTTGRALVLANTANDLSWIARIGGRAFYTSGLRPEDRVVHCLNYCMWSGGVTDHMSLEATGACVIPFGIGQADKLLGIIRELKVTAISCTPSYPALLEERLREAGCNPRDLGLRLGLFGGEAGLDNLQFREKLAQAWGFSVRNANYGMSEVMSTFASQSEHSNDLHFHAADAIFPEIIDARGNSIPISEGNTGELVCTHLRKESQPIIRYRTRDLITITGVERAKCGRTGWRFRVIGRSDDMFNVRGINVFPSSVQNIVLSFPDLFSGQFRILQRGEGPWNYIELRVEASRTLTTDQYTAACYTLELAIKNRIGASAQVELLHAGSLPKTAEKTSLIERI